MAYEVYILDSSKAEIAFLADVTWEVVETLNVQDRITARIFEQDKFSLVTANQTFIRLVNPDDATDKRTYRIKDKAQEHTAGRFNLAVTGVRIWADMGREMYVGYHPFKGSQVKNIVTEVLTDSQFQIKSGGTAESDTTEIDFIELSYITVLDALQRIADEVGLELEIDESTSPESIDLTARGANNNVQLIYAGNMAGITRTTDEAVENQIYPIGGGDPPATCKGAIFEVQSVAAQVITVKGDKCIPSSTAYTDGEKVEFITGADASNGFVISATVTSLAVDTDTITVVGDISAVVAGDKFKFVDGSDNELDFVPDKVSKDTYGTWDGRVENSAFEDIRSLILSGFMDGNYTAGLHDGWEKEGAPTTTEESDVTFIRFGDASQKVVAGSAGLGVKEVIDLDGSSRYSSQVQLYVTSGSVQVKIEGTNGEEFINAGGTSGTEFINVELVSMPIEGATATMSILSVGGAATFYIDAVSFTGTTQVKQYVRENGARELYRLAFDYLLDNKDPEISYNIPNIIDFYELDPAGYPFNQISMGDTVTVIDPDLSLAATPRVLTLSWTNRGGWRGISGIALSSHTNLEAAFNSVNGAAGDTVKMRRELMALNNNIGELTKQTRGANARIDQNSPFPSRGPQFDGDYTSTSHNSFDIGSGTLRLGPDISYAIGAQSITGLNASTIYYMYFDPASASSGFQVTTDAFTAYAVDVIYLATTKTGADALESVQIFPYQDTISRGEIHNAGLEAYDDGGTLRVDIGDISDLGAFLNPSDWGVTIVDGILWQQASVAALSGGAGVYYWRLLDIAQDTGSNTIRQTVADQVNLTAKNVGVSLIGYQSSIVSAAGGTGDAIGSSIFVRAVGTAAQGIGLQVDVEDGGDIGARGLYVLDVETSGDGNVAGLEVLSTQSTGAGDVFAVLTGTLDGSGGGDVYGVFISNNISVSGGGTAYALYSAATEASYFEGALTVNGALAAATVDIDGGTMDGVVIGGAVPAAATVTTFTSTGIDDNATSTAITIDSSERVGIGSVAPGYALEVLATGAQFSTRINDSSLSFWIDTSSGDARINARNAANATKVFFNTNGDSYLLGGNVGIGETSPQVLLHLFGGAAGSDPVFAAGDLLLLEDDGDVQIHLHSPNTSNPAIVFSDDDALGQGQIDYQHTDNLMNFRTNGTVKMVIESGGNVGIGTGIPDGTLHVHTASAGAVTATVAGDDFIIENSDNAGMSILCPDNDVGTVYFGTPSDDIGAFVRWDYTNTQMSISTNIAGGEIAFWTATSADAMLIDSFGKVGIGETSPDHILHVKQAISSPTIQLEATGSEAAGPNFTLFFNTSSPADDDQVGYLNFLGRNSAAGAVGWARFYVVSTDVTDGTEDSDMYWEAQLDGVANTAMFLTGAGVLSVDADGGGSDTPVLVFDEFDDALEIERAIKRDPMLHPDIEKKLFWYNNNGRRMRRINPTLDLLGGAAYQNHYHIESVEERVERLEAENVDLRAEIDLLKKAA